MPGLLTKSYSARSHISCMTLGKYLSISVIKFSLLKFRDESSIVLLMPLKGVNAKYQENSMYYKIVII